MDTVYINVYMTLYNKRTQIEANENAAKVTGVNPLQTLKVARAAFNMLEQDAIYTNNETQNIIIYCTWLDNRRRDIYYWYLSKKGYRYGKLPDTNRKCIFKKFKKGEYIIK